MLLELDLSTIRIVDEELQYPIGSPALDADASNTACAEFLRSSFDVIGLKAKVAEQATLVASILGLEEFEEAAAPGVQKESVTLAGRVAEFVGYLESQHADIESFDGRQVACAQADM